MLLGEAETLNTPAAEGEEEGGSRAEGRQVKVIGARPTITQDTTKENVHGENRRPSVPRGQHGVHVGGQ